jgi:hypothetical protein
MNPTQKVEMNLLVTRLAFLLHCLEPQKGREGCLQIAKRAKCPQRLSNRSLKNRNHCTLAEFPQKISKSSDPIGWKCMKCINGQRRPEAVDGRNARTHFGVVVLYQSATLESVVKRVICRKTSYL